MTKDKKRDIGKGLGVDFRKVSINMMYKRKLSGLYKCLLFLSICTMITGCRNQINTVDNNQGNDLDEWIGKYHFQEAYDGEEYAPLIMDYEITIFKENDNYYANVEVIGQTTRVDVKAEIFGSDKWISLVYLENLSDIVTGKNKINEVLLSFKKEENIIYTYWGGITPMLNENDVSGQTYFQQSK